MLIEEIRKDEYTPLSGKHIALGITSSVAAYRSVDLARKLIRMGAEVRPILTRFATRLIGPDLLWWATGNKPLVEMTGETEHIDVAKWADALVIAPATLNTMSKIAYGILDELLSLTAATMMGDGKKIIIAPAMNIRLYTSPQYERARKLLEEYNAVIIPPFIEENKVKFPPLEDLAHCIDTVLNRGQDLKGKRIIVTAGATREYLDPVRVLTNPSSGLMGILIAREAACRGAQVDLVSGVTRFNPPYMVRNLNVETTSDMAVAVERLTSENEYDAGVFAAAPADYKPKVYYEEKLSTRSSRSIVIELEATRKVLKAIVKRPKVLIGFAAESSKAPEELVEKSMVKLHDYGLDLIVANNILSERAGFSKPFLEVCYVWKEGFKCPGESFKEAVARTVVDYVAGRFNP
ncbi:bifunctional phosphopantothenoylcysteine decarboxylase/phosphopantothenate--cysteine ligase CoaBC [Thermosphaera aggregans]|uniref:Coenzyme A biosynthesis bifunctional protein CoaBC n=1 Tax=Thermosphaera aggregans (strain DSM 11486 / M11TL) TaxID=633148 RepID=D5U1D1_THEAM|nr:bifunctional phosphopantothenoylcysteine decarboxylase/phosphopantothenate--cysteine ligase CoaBC [Thermosphaera aggregans]ADG90931.1 Phosphopantothenoylcysteine decarboxylase; Phosphopantothenate-cysteine ligase [Thermosphaera aggregans DSM 11486]